MIRLWNNKELSPVNDKDIQSLKSFLKKYGGNHVSHLSFLKDKEFFWDPQRKVLILYKRIGKKLFVLGDPLGDPLFFYEGIKQFITYSQKNGCNVFFYQVSQQFIPHYLETGYRVIKIGEEAIVNLHHFSLRGKSKGNLRTALNKLNRSGYSFQIMEPPYSEKTIAQLRSISQQWLGSRQEKSFSVAFFSEDYISHFPLGIITDPNGDIVAFATLATNYRKKISIDLMRKTPHSPNGTMEALFVHIFKWAKEKDFEQCSLGMAPLTNVGTDANASYYEKLLHFIYEKSNKRYNFKGLKRFKDKFACTWEPKYIAYHSSFLPLTFIQLLTLIHQQPNEGHYDEMIEETV
ncbi:phosphatidylglycerol lysyltransferase domain-containing protein [Salirhabdus salicampi]|uniref:phosphatidylglycerol lysyltransferase domain-containing protein n=1 Tax=Salirhabdus salicampi TaxID=476102 RepID=UPI0020C465F7|nr:phosphatidylglycerol lysyltransferase domain-containing protein [Salirhabdus salicampi]MCP8617882.1 phosphatidylglycerol lysyltransferase domain-containing protein [Salirhabdus salicampi]